MSSSTELALRTLLPDAMSDMDPFLNMITWKCVDKPTIALSRNWETENLVLIWTSASIAMALFKPAARRWSLSWQR